MFDLGWQELFIIGTVTLIVVGPKDLPKLLNKVGKVFGKIKQVSREFYDQINETAEIEELTTFYKSDLGQKTLKLNTTISQAISAKTRDISQMALNQAKEELAFELQKKLEKQ